MRAVVQDEYGDTADVLRPGEMARPEPGAGEVLVRVAAAGVDRGVWHLMAGKPYAARLAFGLRAPRNPVRGWSSPAGWRRSAPRSRGSGRATRCSGSARDPSPSTWSRRGEGGGQARLPDVRPGGGDAGVGVDGTAGGARPRARVGRAEGARDRRVRRRGHVRRADRQGVRRRGHRRLQHGEGRPGARRSAPTPSSTTRRPTSPTPACATTSCSTSAATVRCAGCAGC